MGDDLQRMVEELQARLAVVERDAATKDDLERFTTAIEKAAESRRRVAKRTPPDMPRSWTEAKFRRAGW